MAEQEMVMVEQRDRVAAADVVKVYRGNKNNDWQGRIRKGEADDGEMAQAFARHRLAATKAADERVRVLEQTLRNIAEGNLGDLPWQAGYNRIREVARAALAETGGRGG